MNKKHTLSLSVLCAVFVLSLVACTPQQSTPKEESNSKGDEPIAAVSTAWSPEADCTACHSDFGSAGLSKAHIAQGDDCLTCHDADELQAVHDEHGDSGKQPKRLKYTEISTATCLASECHVSKEDIIAQTEDIVITDKNGLSVNPHNAPAGVQEHDDLACDDCHSGHENQDILADAEKRCFGCHHQQVFECGTCHAH